MPRSVLARGGNTALKAKLGSANGAPPPPQTSFVAKLIRGCAQRAEVVRSRHDSPTEAGGEASCTRDGNDFRLATLALRNAPGKLLPPVLQRGTRVSLFFSLPLSLPLSLSLSLVFVPRSILDHWFRQLRNCVPRSCFHREEVPSCVGERKCPARTLDFRLRVT